MLEDRFAQNDKEIVDKYHNPEADYTMSVRDYVLRPKADGDSGPIVITLPPVAEAKGRSYSFLCRGADGINSVTITHNADFECWDGFIFYNTCDSVLFDSDGLYWHMQGALKCIFCQIFITI
mgnify:CR=1 FL=1